MDNLKILILGKKIKVKGLKGLEIKKAGTLTTLKQLLNNNYKPDVLVLTGQKILRKNRKRYTQDVTKECLKLVIERWPDQLIVNMSELKVGFGYYSKPLNTNNININKLSKIGKNIKTLCNSKKINDTKIKRMIELIPVLILTNNFSNFNNSFYWKKEAICLHNKLPLKLKLRSCQYIKELNLIKN